jgi:hypothetical protein
MYWALEGYEGNGIIIKEDEKVAVMDSSENGTE